MQYITREIIRNNPDKVFLFGDNLAGKGYGGQAREMRGEPNSIGIPTKHYPSSHSSSYFTDAEYDRITRYIGFIFDKIPKDKTIVVPANGIGTGLAELPTRAPRIFNYIQTKLQEIEKGS